MQQLLPNAINLGWFGLFVVLLIAVALMLADAESTSGDRF